MRDFGTLLNVEQVAERLAVRPCTVRAWVWKRKLPFIKVGDLVRFTPEDIEDFLRKNRREVL